MLIMLYIYFSERLPGDGEASLEDDDEYDDDPNDDDEDEEAIDGLDDDCLGGSDVGMLIMLYIYFSERLPGDGEASLEDDDEYDDDPNDDDEDDEAIDGLDDDCLGGSDVGMLIMLYIYFSERLPGDGEASLEDDDEYDDDPNDDDEDDEAIDGLDDDCIGGSDDVSYVNNVIHLF